MARISTLCAHLVATSLIILPLTATHAYTDNDISYVSLNPPAGWSLVGTQKTPNQTVMAYNNKMNPRETMMLTTILKPYGLTGNAMAREFYKGISEEMIKNGCTANPLKSSSQKKALYQTWTASFTCKIGKTSGTMMFIDGDAKTFYFMVHKSPAYPISSTEFATQLKEFKSMIQVCYKGKCEKVG